MKKILIVPRKLIIVLVILGLCWPAPGSWARRHSRPNGVSARAVVFSDITHGKKLYSKNADQRIFVASTTKVMTALLVLENLPLDRYVTVSRRATMVQPSKLYLRAGDEYTVRDLMYALLLNSANDASVVLAEAVAGSQEKFVMMMNERARQLGADKTKFANPHGLPSRGEQYSTANDMVLIFREALKKDFFRQTIGYRYKTISSRSGRRHWLKTHNTTLFRSWKIPFYGKTGYTRAAGFCFLGYAQQGKTTYVIGVFGCSRRRNQDIRYIAERFGKLDL